MAKEYTLLKKFVGYGHYEFMIVDNEGNTKSAIINNVDLITRLSSEIDKEKKEATDEAIALVLASK